MCGTSNAAATCLAMVVLPEQLEPIITIRSNVINVRCLSNTALILSIYVWCPSVKQSRFRISWRILADHRFMAWYNREPTITSV